METKNAAQNESEEKLTARLHRAEHRTHEVNEKEIALFKSTFNLLPGIFRFVFCFSLLIRCSVPSNKSRLRNLNIY